jgi:hypothetical protein
VDTDGFVNLARSTSREEFLSRVASSFLLLENPLREQDVGFATQVVDPAAVRRAAQTQKSKPAPNVEVLPVAKSPQNPYPDRVSVGRARNCDVVLRDPSVSKLHAHFRIGQPRLELVDIDSQNGTRVNGRPLPAHQPLVVTPGDVILFGSVSVKLVDADTLYDLLR